MGAPVVPGGGAGAKGGGSGEGVIIAVGICCVISALGLGLGLGLGLASDDDSTIPTYTVKGLMSGALGPGMENSSVDATQASMHPVRSVGLHPMRSIAVGRYVACAHMDVASAKDLYRRFEAIINCSSPLTSTFPQQRTQGNCTCGQFNVKDTVPYGYFTDRCWNPRMLCSLAIAPEHGSSANMCGEEPMFVTQDSFHQQSGSTLEAGRYVTVLGPAAAIGVNARRSFADRLRTSLGMQVLNFGKSGAGPSAYLQRLARDAAFSNVLYHSAAVVIVLMAGRSSADHTDADKVNTSVNTSGFRYDHAAKNRLRLWREQALEKVNSSLAAQLRNESMQTAEDEYVALAREIRRGTPSSAASPMPELVLVWMSAIELTSRKENRRSRFPQYFTISSDRYERVRRIASAMDAQLVDASFNFSSKPLALDQCRGCPLPSATRNATCSTSTARNEYGKNTNLKEIPPQYRWPDGEQTLGCTSHCTHVESNYYPDEGMHTHASNLLHHVLAKILRKSPVEKASKRAGRSLLGIGNA